MTEERRLKRLEQNRKSWHKNKEKYAERRRLKRIENPEKYKEWDRKQYVKNREKVIKRVISQSLERRKNDPVYKLKHNLSTSIQKCIRRINSIKTNRTINILGIDYVGLMEHLESQFEPWMNWDNYGKYKIDTFNYGWDIDHIIPICTADTIEDVYRLNHYTNLKPLCSKVNRDIKRDRYSPDF
jgi:hypothetical protein